MLPLLLIGALLSGAAFTGDGALNSRTREGLAVRERHGLPIPTGNVVVYIHSFAAHHETMVQSAVAWRDASGRWRLSKVVEIGPGLLDAPRTIESDVTEELSSINGRRLDRLLRDRDLYFQPGHQKDVGVGAPFHTMEVVTPRQRRVISWTGRLRGPGGAIADMLIGGP